MRRILGGISRGIQAWTEWMERRGFLVTLGVCVAVIIGSAIWARIPDEQPQPSVQAGDQIDQLLSNALGARATPTPTPAPTATPAPLWKKPVPGAIQRAYSPTLPIYSKTLDAWVVHMGVDLKTNKSENVYAPTGGTVVCAGKTELYGLTAEILDTDGETVRISGLGALNVSEGTKVISGDKLGTAGGIIPIESLDAPHLHVEWISEGERLNPAEKWK